MTAYAILDTNGQLVSVGTVVADPLPAGLTVVDISDAEYDGLRNGSLIWNGSAIVTNPVWVETARLESNRLAIDAAIAAAISKLDTLIAAPALGTVPAGTMTTAQLSTALRTLRDGAQATRAGAQDVALILKQTIKLVRGDYDTVT